MTDTIATWFYMQDDDEGGTYAQVKGRSHSERFRDVYRRCIGVFLVTAREANPSASLVVYLNRPWDPFASRVAFEVFELMQDLQVQVRVVPYRFEPPPGWTAAWRNQFFVFDVLADLSEVVEPSDRLVVLDSDIVWTGLRVERLWQAIGESGGLRYVVGYPPEKSINGLSQTELADVARSIAPRLGLEPTGARMIPYAGGEFVALRGDVASQLVDLARVSWPHVVDDFRAGASVFAEEAHMLSFLYAQLSVARSEEGLVRRVWTRLPGFRNAQPTDLGLALIHVPAEKRFGIPRLYRRLVRLRRPVPGANELAADLGIPRPSAAKVLRDGLTAVAATLREVARG